MSEGVASIAKLFKSVDANPRSRYVCVSDEEKLGLIHHMITDASEEGLSETTFRIGCELDYVCEQLSVAGFKVKIDAQPLRLTVYWGQALKQFANQ